ncbi:MAG: CBS domain-containing protein [Clostridioides sp.]|jgi:CBS domain-containing protein|nr:CBS domain-containing protein [Clostridioides sp.]
MDKFARDIMTSDVVVANYNDKVEDVAKLLIEKKIGGMPVLDSEDRVIGIISETDILKKEKYVATPPFINIIEGVFYLEDFRKLEEDIKEIAAYQIKDLMSKKIVTVHENDTFDDVANIMIKKSINRVPVVDDENRLKGIICRYDIIKALYDE